MNYFRTGMLLEAMTAILLSAGYLLDVERRIECARAQWFMRIGLGRLVFGGRRA